MRLVSLQLENFRCYKNNFSITFDDLTAIIGKNDVGKSAIMDALSIFFEEGELDKGDGSVSGDCKSIRISCEFDQLPAKLVIDKDYETTLEKEYLVNSEGRLEIVKTYDGLLSKPKLVSIEAHCLHPTETKFDDLLQLKKSELLDRAKLVSCDLSGVNKQANAPIRAAIWSSCADLKIAKSTISLEKEGGKQLWESLSVALPAFALFKSDRESTDQDAEAQDPLKAAIKDAIKDVEEQLQKVQKYVESEAQKIAKATVEKIREMDASLAENFQPIITTKKWDTLFQASITGENGISLNKRGSGVKRLVLLNFFRAKAERSATENNSGSVIYAIEEPETSQHPRNQRMLMSALRDLAGTPGRQVIITTHTPMLARALPDNALRFIEKVGDDSRTVTMGGADANARIASSLGVLPDHNVKLFIGVEGKHDISFLKGMSRMLRASGCPTPDFERLELDGEIIFFPFGGSNLALWSSRLVALNRPEYHICDRDTEPPAQPKYQAHVDAVNARNDCKAVVTTKKEMENYLHHDAICEAYQASGVDIAFAGLFADHEDVPVKVAEAVYNASGAGHWSALDEPTRAKKSSKAKSMLNNAAIDRMTRERLDAVDPAGEVIQWLTEIETILTNEL